MAEQPPIDRDALARQLRARVQQQRPRRSRTLLFLLLLTAACFGVVAGLFWPRAEPPRLNVIGFDQLARKDANTSITAWLTPQDPGVNAGNLEGLDVYFEAMSADPGKPGWQRKAVSQRSGRVDLPCDPFGIGIQELKITYASASQRYHTEDRARVFVWPDDQRPVVFVEVDAVAATNPASWQASRFPGITAREKAALALKALHEKNYYVVYIASGAATPMQYRLMRGWVESKTGAGGLFPDGPVLGLDAKVTPLLAGRVGSLAVARTPRLAEAFRDAGLKTYLLAEAAETPAGVTRLAAWGDLVKDEKENDQTKKRQN